MGGKAQEALSPAEALSDSLLGAGAADTQRSFSERSPHHVRIADLTDHVRQSISDVALIDEAEELIGAIRAKAWQEPDERRFACAVVLANVLIQASQDSSIIEGAPICEYFGATLCHKLKRGNTPTGRLPSIVASILLAPQPDYESVEGRFPSDISLISALFSMPLMAAKIRFDFGQQVVAELDEHISGH